MLGINRTSVELKHEQKTKAVAVEQRINRTSVELKQGNREGKRG